MLNLAHKMTFHRVMQGGRNHYQLAHVREVWNYKTEVLGNALKDDPYVMVKDE